MKNPTVEKLLKEIKEIHEQKNADYSNGENPYSNFEYAARVADIFTNPIDKVFATLVAIKLARIAELRKPGRVPLNEALADSFKDKDTYNVIWSAYVKETS